MDSTEIRVIAPSHFADFTEKAVKKAEKRLEDKGYTISFCEGLVSGKPTGIGNSLSIDQRITDLEQAYLDSSVKIIIPIIGGYNSNQLLPHIDFDIIKANPKVFCGYSDITVLNNAIYAKTGQITYSGPNFKNFGIYDETLFNFIFDSFIENTTNQSQTINYSQRWIDEKVYEEPKGEFYPNNGPEEINSGDFSGKLIGGNLCSFNLLHGTEYMPDLMDTIVFIEDDHIFTSTKTFLLEFERNLVSLTHQPNFDNVNGLLIGRFEKRSGITIDMLKEILTSIPALSDLPILANLDFGHTSPLITLPIGRMISYKAGILTV